MATARRKGSESSETRARLLDVTERLMLKEGYAAVSSRRVASAADVTPALVHYYFGTIDDLFLAVLRRRADGMLERQRDILRAADNPIRALWDAANDPARTGFVLEFMSLANHRKVVRAELAAYSDRFRTMQLEVVSEFVERRGVDTTLYPPMVIIMMINALSQNLVLEQSIGMTVGLAETTAYIERLIAGLPAD